MSEPITPHPAAIAITEAMLKMLTDQVAASLGMRIDELEKAQKAVEPTAEFIEKVRDAVLADDAFDDAVVNVMGNRATEVVGELEDDIKKLGMDDLGDKVSEVIRRGSFSVDFSPY